MTNYSNGLYLGVPPPERRTSRLWIPLVGAVGALWFWICIVLA